MRKRTKGVLSFLLGAIALGAPALGYFYPAATPFIPAVQKQANSLRLEILNDKLDQQNAEIAKFNSSILEWYPQDNATQVQANE